MSDLLYKEIRPLSREEVAEAVKRNEPESQSRAVIAVVLHELDHEFAQELCVRLSKHPHFNVRGNAILGFGHLARIHRHLNQAIVQPIVAAALCDPNDFIRGQAHAACDDTAFFLNWDYSNIQQP